LIKLRADVTQIRVAELELHQSIAVGVDS